MVKKDLKLIFLSASIPLKERNPKYYNTADIVAIRDAVRALATIVLPNSRLIWGGHPAITPLIRYVMKNEEVIVRDHVVLYQSEDYKEQFPDDNRFFESIKIVPGNVLKMRQEMLMNYNFDVGFFIGGMEGVEDEFEMFGNLHPKAFKYPIASTGAAARIIYDRMSPKPDERLIKDYAYMALFRSIINEITMKK